MIKNILFDLGNVLIDIDVRRTLRAYQALLRVQDSQCTMHNVISAGDLIGAGESEWVAKYQVGAISTEEFVEAVLPACKPGTTRQDVIDAWMAMLIGIPEERRQKLAELHKQGYKLYVLSNINELHAEWTREQLKGIPFEAVFFSNEIRMAKPDIRCYERVIKETGIKLEETLYIDDIPANIEAGEKMGFQCFLNSKNNEWYSIV